MALGDKGTVFVSQRTHDGVFAIVDKGDHREVKTDPQGAATRRTASPSPTARCMSPSASASRATTTSRTISTIRPSPRSCIDDLPQQGGPFLEVHGDGPGRLALFQPVGSPTNITMPTYIQAAILRVEPDQHVLEIYAHGVRNTVGMDVQPGDQAALVHRSRPRLARRRLPIGRAEPRDRARASISAIRSATRATRSTRSTARYATCAEFDAARRSSSGRTSPPLGMRFYTGKMFPADWTEQHHHRRARLVEPHREVGLQPDPRVAQRAGQGGQVRAVSRPGCCNGQDILARLVDVQVMPDGSLLVSDDWNGAIYRISYKKT